MRHLVATFTAFLALSPSVIFALPTTATCERPAPWRRLTNRILSSIWKRPAPQNEVETRIHPITGARSGRPDSLAARYGQDIVLRFNVSTVEEANALAEASEDLYLDVWEFNDNWVDIRLAKDVVRVSMSSVVFNCLHEDQVPSLLGLLPPSLQNAHAPLMPGLALAEVISRSLPSSEHPSFTPELKPSSKDLFFADYQPLSVIEPWMRLLTSMFPTHTRLISIGLTYEGRDIPALRVGVHPTNDEQPSKPRDTMIISGGIHAREWISTSTVNYVAWQLITSYGKSLPMTRLLETFDFVFIPTLNPDGYVHTWTTDRLWRKNRQPTPLRFCRGIDLDRSFGFQWDGDAGPTGGNPCSESYAGEEPWQAAEARAFSNWARNETEANNVQFIAFIDLHSYSQQVLYPYSYSCRTAPPTLENLEELALGLAKAMRLASSGHYYRTTSACEGNVATVSKGASEKRVRLPRIDQTGGGSALDWFYHELRVKYAYQIKLRDTGSYGFLLPRENIVPQGKEMLNAILYLGKYLMGEVGMNGESGEAEEEGGERLTKVPHPELKMQMGPVRPVELFEADEPLLGTGEIQWELKRRRRR